MGRLFLHYESTIKFCQFFAVGTVKLLLSLGADPNLHGKWGKVEGRPIDFAKQKKHSEILQILQEFEDLDEEEVDEFGKKKVIP